MSVESSRPLQQKDKKVSIGGASNKTSGAAAAGNGQLKSKVPVDDEMSSAEAAAAAAEINVNFMSKFRDKDTRVLKNLNSTQFMEVWNNYDKDGEYLFLFFIAGQSLSHIDRFSRPENAASSLLFMKRHVD